MGELKLSFRGGRGGGGAKQRRFEIVQALRRERFVGEDFDKGVVDDLLIIDHKQLMGTGRGHQDSFLNERKLGLVGRGRTTAGFGFTHRQLDTKSRSLPLSFAVDG